MDSKTRSAAYIAEIEAKAAKLRLTMREVCEEAMITQGAWSAAKARVMVGPKLTRKLEAAMDRIEARR